MSRELIESWTDYSAAVTRLLGMASQHLHIYDQDLQALKLDTTESLASLSALLARHGDHPLCIALRDGGHFQTRSPRLRGLCTTWAHRAAVRQTPAALSHLRDNMLLVDGLHALIRLEKKPAAQRTHHGRTGSHCPLCETLC